MKVVVVETVVVVSALSQPQWTMPHAASSMTRRHDSPSGHTPVEQTAWFDDAQSTGGPTQLQPPRPSLWHACPVEHTPPQEPPPREWHGGSVVVLVHVELVVVVLPIRLLVVVATQPPFPQASQQLDSVPVQALPPCGAVQVATFLLIEHLITPVALVRQQVTNPGRPQVECAAQRFSCPRQS